MADPKLLPLFSQSIQFFAPSVSGSINNYGRRTFASVAASFNARVQEDEQIIRDANGRQVLQTGVVYLYELSPVITTDFKCILPDGKETIVIGVDYVYDEDGPNHQKIRIGR